MISTGCFIPIFCIESGDVENVAFKYSNNASLPEVQREKQT